MPRGWRVPSVVRIYGGGFGALLPARYPEFGLQVPAVADVTLPVEHFVSWRDFVAEWKLGEASGVRYDTGPNGLTLDDNNTVGSASGSYPCGATVAALFDPASSEYLSRPSSDAVLEFGGAAEPTFSCWFQPTGSGTDNYYGSLISKFNAAGACNFLVRLEYMWYPAQRRMAFFFQNAAAVFTPTGDVTIVPNGWNHVIAWRASGTCYIQLNGGTVYSQAGSASSATQDLGVQVGSREGLQSHCFKGMQLYHRVWSRPLTAPERGDLWNGGAGW